MMCRIKSSEFHSPQPNPAGQRPNSKPFKELWHGRWEREASSKSDVMRNSGMQNQVAVFEAGYTHKPTAREGSKQKMMEEPTNETRNRGQFPAFTMKALRTGRQQSG